MSSCTPAAAARIMERNGKTYAAAMNHAYGYAITTTTSDAAMGLPKRRRVIAGKAIDYGPAMLGSCGAMIVESAPRLTPVSAALAAAQNVVG